MIMIDDDERFDRSYIRRLREAAEPKTYMGWYGRKITLRGNYWGNNEPTYPELMNGLGDSDIKFDYRLF